MSDKKKKENVNEHFDVNKVNFNALSEEKKAEAFEKLKSQYEIIKSLVKELNEQNSELEKIGRAHV